ncbi:hypothetical protein HPP92_002095 [Vanilla planifolia]|uniref:Uncharacterized protein n=1 Tax=Vanilla planifolia TaxID=51239 RepID=A0A835RST6_VANPL|nr:hypothetical protein HPP92_002095 [Vanilla planifolia]
MKVLKRPTTSPQPRWLTGPAPTSLTVTAFPPCPTSARTSACGIGSQSSVGSLMRSTQPIFTMVNVSWCEPQRLQPFVFRKPACPPEGPTPN